MTTIEQTTYVVQSAAEHAAEMHRALTEAQQALAAARQRLAAHEAQTPTDPDAWGDEWARLTGRVKACERIVEQAARAYEQARAVWQQQQVADWYAERDRLADELDAEVNPLIAEIDAAMKRVAELRRQIDAARHQFIEHKWTPHARAGEPLRIPLHEHRILQLGGHGEFSGPPLFVPRTGRKPPLQY